jgi:phosphopantetheine--protein transferase-like protein
VKQAAQSAEALRQDSPNAAPEPVASALGVGVDIECIENLPPTADWSDPFYQEHFAPAEIEWCVRQPDIRSSFCSLWSAKEAAIKCNQELAALRPSEIEVRHDARGRPMLHVSRASHRGIAGECALSMSRSGETCIAVCVRRPSGAAAN